MTANHLLACYLSILMFFSFQAYSLFGLFRVNELLLLPVLILHAWTFMKKNEKILIVAIVFLIAAIFSSLVGAIRSEEGFIVEELVFYYKYIYLMLVLFSVPKIEELLKSARFEGTFKMLYIICVVILFSYVIYSVFFIFDPLSAATGLTRVSLMLTDTTGSVSNSPLYSVMLALSLIALFEGVKLSKDRYIALKYLIIFAVFLSLVFTGSRSGILLIAIYGLSILIKKLDFKALLILLIFTYSVYALSGLFERNQEFGLYGELLERSLNFELSSDESAMSRTEKQFRALEDSVETGFLLGVGHENTDIRWYDGALGNLIVFSGLVGTLLFYVMVGFYVIKLHKDYGWRLVRFFLVFLFINFVSEYYLTANGVIFFVFSMLYVILTAPERKS